MGTDDCGRIRAVLGFGALVLSVVLPIVALASGWSLNVFVWLPGRHLDVGVETFIVGCVGGAIAAGILRRILPPMVGTSPRQRHLETLTSEQRRLFDERERYVRGTPRPTLQRDQLTAAEQLSKDIEVAIGRERRDQRLSTLNTSWYLASTILGGVTAMAADQVAEGPLTGENLWSSLLTGFVAAAIAFALYGLGNWLRSVCADGR